MSLLTKIDAFLVRCIIILENLDLFNYTIYSFDAHDVYDITYRGKYKSLLAAKRRANYLSKFSEYKTFKIYKGFFEVK